MIQWKDPLEWMEQMSSTRWQQRMEKENKHFDSAVRAVANEEKVQAAILAFQESAAEWQAHSAWKLDLGKSHIYVFPQNGGIYRWISKKHTYFSADLDTSPNGIVVFTHDVSNGEGNHAITALQNDKVIWTRRSNKYSFSSELAIHKGRVYLLEAEEVLRYKWVVSFDLATGKEKRTHYEEDDPNHALTFIRGENGCLFLMSDNSGRQKLFLVDGSVRRLSPGAISFFPVGFAPNSTDPCYFMKAALEDDWTPEGVALRSFHLPKGFLVAGIDTVFLRHGLFISRRHGERIIYRCSKKTAKRVTHFFGEMEIHPWDYWHGTGSLVEFRLVIPGQTPVRGTIERDFKFEAPFAAYGTLLTGVAKSADGSAVQWLTISNKNEAVKGVIISAYGAYNVATSMDTARWKPYLEHGIAIGIAFVRGGGDHTDAWAEAGRVHRKVASVEDFEACVKDIRKEFQLTAQQTCIFGRSAGGYLVGAAAARDPHGRLFKTVYAEVPYVDVLRTASNSKLPLTEYELLEFGDPLHKIADFETLLRLGPVTALTEEGAPGLYVVCRTAMNDRQVYAYESLKWIERLRGMGGEDKLLEIAKNQGHFTQGEALYAERASDYLLITKRIAP